MAETAVAPGVTYDKAGFATRVAAFVIDAIVVWAVAAAAAAVLFDADARRGTGVAVPVALSYHTYFWSAPGRGQTLGMRAFGIAVVRTSSAPLSATDALVRYVGLLLSLAVALIGVLWIAFDARRQGWHDKLTGTLVVRT